MLFDLQGKRRRVVQATYLMLAVLMGGGLVLFGIGGETSGGLFDAFSGGGGSGGNEVVEERVDRNEDRVKANPKADAARKELVRDYYSLAVAQTDQAGTFPPDAQDELRNASTHWNAYLDSSPKRPDASLARVALQVYDPTALNQPEQALRAARVLAEQSRDASSYLLLVQYATLAGDKRTEKLAAQKAVDLAPKAQRKAVREQITQIKAQAIASQLQESDIDVQGGAPAPGGGGSGNGKK
jgi:hypothetical protein